MSLPRCSSSSPARRAAGLSLVLLLPLAPPVRADEGDRSIWLDHPNAARAAAMGYVSAPKLLGGGPSDIFGGVTYSRQLLERLALEGTVGAGGQGRHAGVHLGLGARVLVRKRDAEGAPAGLTVALGTHAALLHDYGPVAFLRTEAAWEVRARGGFNLVAGGGLAAPLNDSRRVDNCSGWSRGEGLVAACDDRFSAGSIGPWAHVELGWSF